MNDAVGAFVCGFGDLEAGLGGLAWDLGEPGALLLDEGEVQPATFALEIERDITTVVISAGDDSVEATLSPERTLIEHPDTENPVELKGVACTAEVRSKGDNPTFESRGQISRWIGDPLDGAAVLRHLAIGGPTDSLLLATARGTPDAGGHGSEHTVGWLLSAESGVPYEEALISTQYDGGGDPTRLGLELWPEDADQSSRAAATRVSGSLLGGVRAGPVWAGLFRCHADGVAELGSYLLWRA
jgi:hypothetical protein